MIGVPETISPDEEIEITITGSSRIDQSISVTINNGEGDTEVVQVPIDSNGNGSATWVVPGEWAQAEFNDGHCAEVTRPVSS